MSLLLKSTIYTAIVLIAACIYAVLISVLGIEISGSMGDRIALCSVEILLSWGLFLGLLKLSGAKITWQN